MYIIILIYFLLLLYSFFIWKNNYWKNANIPYVEPKLFYGSIKEAIKGKKHFAILFNEWYRKFNNVPYIGFYKMREPAIVIKDPDIIRNILIKDYNYFANNDIQIDPHNDEIWLQNVFSQIGGRWKKNRNAWTTSLTTTKVKTLFDNMELCCNNMVDHIKKHVENNENDPIESRLLSSTVFVDIVANSIFGLSMNSFKTPNNPFIILTKSFQFSPFLDGIAKYIAFISPWLCNVLKFKFIDKNMENQLLNIAKDVLEKRKEKKLHNNNIFDSILMNRYVGENEKIDEIGALEVAGIIFAFLVDGSETTSNAFGFLLYAIAANPQVQAKLRTEIDEVCECDGKLTYENINNMQYLEMILLETLRLYQPLPIMQKICTKSYTLPPMNVDGIPLVIPVGMTVVIPIYSLHTDPNYFEEPEKFNPERFNEENKRNIIKGTYYAFSDGPRICLGSRLGRSQLKMAAVYLIKNFEVRVALHMKNKPIKLDPNNYMMRATDGLWVTFHKRTD